MANLEITAGGMAQSALYWVGCGCLSLGALILLAQVSPAASNVLFKLRLFSHGAAHFVLSRDKALKALPDPDMCLLVTRPIASSITKRFIFIRHGESEWNSIFNRGGISISMLLRLLTAFFREFAFFTSRESVFFDAGLNAQGAAQATALAQQLESLAAAEPNVSYLMDPNADVLVASSNLRRSICTALIALRRRFEKTTKPLLIHSDLQEITSNVDGVSLAPTRGFLSLELLQKPFSPGAFPPNATLDATFNHGTKPLTRNGFQRILNFNRWAFQRPEQAVVIAGGHSLWFRTFCRLFLPHSVVHASKNKKLSNCGCVAFDITQTIAPDGQAMYRIDPTSFRIISGSFGG